MLTWLGSLRGDTREAIHTRGLSFAHKMAGPRRHDHYRRFERAFRALERGESRVTRTKLLAMADEVAPALGGVDVVHRACVSVTGGTSLNRHFRPL